MPEVVKVQLPLVGDQNTMLVYAEGRRAMCQMPVSRDVLNKLRGDKKGYFSATMINGDWKIGGRVVDRDW